ncbi:hypothetical protein EK21DRAFT_106521 [Setomelanomma holmii]|uniref:Uncharacterized protein n=1 Tax=Setomelanomma holmii TaxID=210430 RepID=A0A9P4HLA5_9PLEO|nr:hypothetical protein EK21DRAFT_106521 [Setomelanomma holmii]
MDLRAGMLPVALQIQTRILLDRLAANPEWEFLYPEELQRVGKEDGAHRDNWWDWMGETHHRRLLESRARHTCVCTPSGGSFALKKLPEIHFGLSLHVEHEFFTNDMHIFLPDAHPESIYMEEHNCLGCETKCYIIPVAQPPPPEIERSSATGPASVDHVPPKKLRLNCARVRSVLQLDTYHDLFNLQKLIEHDVKDDELRAVCTEYKHLLSTRCLYMR